MRTSTFAKTLAVAALATACLTATARAEEAEDFADRKSVV